MSPSPLVESSLFSPDRGSRSLEGNELSSLSTNLFELSRSKRYHQSQHHARAQKSPALMFLALLDRIGLDEVEKYRLEKSAIQAIQMRLRCDGRLPSSFPLHAVWMELKEYQPLDSWSEERFAALYFHSLAPSHLNKLPSALRPRSSIPLLSLGQQWRLELINPNGECLLAYHFDPRDTIWSIAPGHICPWKCCIEETSGEGGLSIHPCSDCLFDLEYISRWFATILASMPSAVPYASSFEEVEVVREEVVPPRWWELWKLIFPRLQKKVTTITLRYTLVHAL